MSEQEETVTLVEDTRESLTETPTEVPKEVPKEFVYEYQPVDELGRSLGAKQVFKGKDEHEVLEKLANAHKEAIKLNRELNKNIRLGTVAQEEELPEDMPRYDEQLDFAPRQLTEDERIQLSRDLLDPERCDEASDRLFEAKLGASPTKITTVLTHAQQDIAAMRTKEEARLFVQANPDYYICPENFQTMTSWMIKNKLAPVKSNFDFAFHKLRAVGLLLEAPIVREDTPQHATATQVTPAVEVAETVVTPENSHPASENTGRITSEETTQQKRPVRIASGLNRDLAPTGTSTTAQSMKLTRSEIEKMSSEEYKRRLLREPNFAKEVEKLYEKR